MKQDAFKQKIVAAEASKKYVHLLEYQVCNIKVGQKLNILCSILFQHCAFVFD